MKSFDKDTYSGTNTVTKDIQINRTGGKLPFSGIYAIRQWSSPRGGDFDININLKAKTGKEQVNAALYIYKNNKLISSKTITNNIDTIIKIPNINNTHSDKIEFAIANHNNKAFDYNLDISIQEKKDENSLTPISWNSASDFRGPIRKIDKDLDAWEKIGRAHV